MLLFKRTKQKYGKLENVKYSAHNWLNNNVIEQVWLVNGGKETLESYERNNFSDINEHRNFFNNLKDYYIDENNNLYLHAGYQSVNGVDDIFLYNPLVVTYRHNGIWMQGTVKFQQATLDH